MAVYPHLLSRIVRKNYKKYVTFNDVDIHKCQVTPKYVLCSGDIIIFNSHERSMWEVQLIMKLEKVPESCKIKYTEERENVFHKLKYKNK